LPPRICQTQAGEQRGPLVRNFGRPSAKLASRLTTGRSWRGAEVVMVSFLGPAPCCFGSLTSQVTAEKPQIALLPQSRFLSPLRQWSGLRSADYSRNCSCPDRAGSAPKRDALGRANRKQTPFFNVDPLMSVVGGIAPPSRKVPARAHPIGVRTSCKQEPSKIIRARSKWKPFSMLYPTNRRRLGKFPTRSF
jgi:hypothetical protein